MSFNVSLTPSLEGFIREKVAQGEYESPSDVIGEALRLLKRRDDLWGAEAHTKIEAGMKSLRAGRTIPAEEVWTKLEKTIASAERLRSGQRK